MTYIITYYPKHGGINARTTSFINISEMPAWLTEMNGQVVIELIHLVAIEKNK